MTKNTIVFENLGCDKNEWENTIVLYEAGLAIESDENAQNVQISIVHQILKRKSAEGYLEMSSIQKGRLILFRNSIVNKELDINSREPS